MKLTVNEFLGLACAPETCGYSTELMGCTDKYTSIVRSFKPSIDANGNACLVVYAYDEEESED